MAAYHDLYEEFEDDRDAHRLTPARVRSALNKVLQETDMKIGEFQRMLGVNANTWGKFMTNNYKDKTWGAAASGTYSAGLYFCYREKRLGSASVLKTRARGGASGGASAADKPAFPDLDGVEASSTLFESSRPPARFASRCARRSQSIRRRSRTSLGARACRTSPSTTS